MRAAVPTNRTPPADRNLTGVTSPASLRRRRLQAGADRGRRGGDAVGGALPAEDVVVRAGDPQHRALHGAALAAGEVAQQALVAAGDLLRELLLLGRRGIARPQ